MSISPRTLCLVAAAIVAEVAFPAHADLSIAKRATKNVSCSGGSCVATARNAVMNVSDLQNLLATQSSVALDAGPAKAVAVDTALTWTSNATLSLIAQASLTVNRPVTVAGSGGVAIQTADSGLSFAPKASLSFWSLSSPLTINGIAYTLVGDIKSMNYFVSSPVAFARDYDASADGTYSESPIQWIQGPNGRLEGLGHTVSRLSMEGGGYPANGFVGQSNGTLTNLHIDGKLLGGDRLAIAVGSNSGLMAHVAATGMIIGSGGTEEAGLAAENTGIIRDSSARVNIRLGARSFTAGLVAVNGGTISNSWSEGTMREDKGLGIMGGLVALNDGTIQNSYTLANTRLPKDYPYDLAHGGLLGQTPSGGNYSSVIASYAAGATAPEIPVPAGANSWQIKFAGGAVGYDGTDSTFDSTYWATDSSRHNPKQPAGNKREISGITGLTEAQLKSGLPAGFDPKVWGQSPSVNNGYPYLLANPPQ